MKQMDVASGLSGLLGAMGSAVAAATGAAAEEGAKDGANEAELLAFPGLLADLLPVAVDASAEVMEGAATKDQPGVKEWALMGKGVAKEGAAPTTAQQAPGVSVPATLLLPARQESVGLGLKAGPLEGNAAEKMQAALKTAQPGIDVPAAKDAARAGVGQELPGKPEDLSPEVLKTMPSTAPVDEDVETVQQAVMDDDEPAVANREGPPTPRPATGPTMPEVIRYRPPAQMVRAEMEAAAPRQVQAGTKTMAPLPVMTDPSLAAAPAAAVTLESISATGLSNQAASGVRAQVLEQVLAQALNPGGGTDGTERLQLQLDPPQLGKVDVQLVSSGQKLVITFQAGSPEVEAALKEGAEKLAEAIIARGGRWADVEVRLERGSGNSREERSSSREDGTRRQRQDGRQENRRQR